MDNGPKPRSRLRRWLGAFGVLVVLATVGGMIAIGFWIIRSVPDDFTFDRGPTGPERVPATAAPVEPHDAAPPQAMIPAPTPGEEEQGAEPQADAEDAAPEPEPASEDPLDAWADEMATVVDAPPRALRAYADAEARLRVEQPGCGLSWTTLVGIGRIESDHGRYGGTRLGDDGLPSSPIYGVPLDGSPGVMAIPDTDGGEMDGDTEWDRAMGPMQFLPTTWELVGRDANGDGVADPQSIDDAALTAATYLCASGGDLTSGTGWWSAVLTYNNSVDYGRRVFGLAEAYSGMTPEES
ncbi:Transglycosylase SLT domain [Actinoalloteichus hymeniacidonis]|uniref:Transglycosylase SLT domain n=2 Tax=Actinoalloteichus hymeniacidonis TaxID=340345 RepID=A0AAC9HLN0_9PSEU|nr:Transglycosylase SLT domain [Actinoalloteichus hymeniacidonis]